MVDNGVVTEEVYDITNCEQGGYRPEQRANNVNSMDIICFPTLSHVMRGGYPTILRRTKSSSKGSRGI